jgi:hypothetical protein
MRSSSVFYHRREVHARKRDRISCSKDASQYVYLFYSCVSAMVNPAYSCHNIFFPAPPIVPVIRPQDLAKPGVGRIQLLNRKTDPLRITGIDTAFTKQLRVRDSLVLPRSVGQAEVVEIISDTEVLIKKEFKDLKALELLTQTDGTNYKCVPHVEQEAVYNSVYDQLNNNRCITIFPEGGSHDRAEMLPLKGKREERIFFIFHYFSLFVGHEN